MRECWRHGNAEIWKFWIKFFFKNIAHNYVHYFHLFDKHYCLDIKMYISYSFIYKNTERCEREDRMMERKKIVSRKLKYMILRVWRELFLNRPLCMQANGKGSVFYCAVDFRVIVWPSQNGYRNCHSKLSKMAAVCTCVSYEICPIFANDRSQLLERNIGSSIHAGNYGSFCLAKDRCRKTEEKNKIIP